MNKVTYKIFLLVLKYLPMVLAICALIHLILGIFGFSTEILSTFVGISILPSLFMILSSYIMKFCITHRLPLYYCLIDVLVGTLDYYVELQLNLITGIYFLLAIIFIVGYTYCHLKYGIKRNEKIVK